MIAEIVKDSDGSCVVSIKGFQGRQRIGTIMPADSLKAAMERVTEEIGYAPLWQQAKADKWIAILH